MPRLYTIVFAAVALCYPVASIAQTGPAKNSEAVHAGQDLFTQKCFQCHSVVQDQVRFGPSLYHELAAPHPKKTPAEIRVILENGKGKMPSFKDVLTKQDVDTLLAYIHSL
jgi:mono/diheme cytochrome c family protein